MQHYQQCGGYEHINQGEEMLYDGAKLLSESSFIYGTGAKLSLETYLSDRIAIIASSKAGYYSKLHKIN
ncbi:conjugal transfer protein TraO [Chryseobacterium indoltheticum]|uniref:conjugal transfer protein TraO n=1 Tax=Chryseobacterium indoltheticum TaxID=254 RepID=UPI003F49426E